MPSVLQAFIPKLLGRAHVTAYVTGNIGSGAAADLTRRVQSLLSDQLKTRPPFPSQVPKHAKHAECPVATVVPETWNTSNCESC